jgi:alkanesulfonate monooxygenase SsuD/methylene tetrahydromethanopterin reductase-like flavin-dependent oxidoreductase (luciferase family)
MKTGVVYPQIELGGDTGAVKAFAQAAEELGYDHMVIYDHVLGAVHAGREPKLTGPYKETDPFHEPLVTYAYLAGVTKHLELVTGVIILPQRQTALFAKQAADVDLFSEGRLRLGVGVGWNWVEYDGLEMSRHFRRRGKRQEQQIALIRKLWEQPVVEYETPTIGSTEPASYRARSDRSPFGSVVPARPRSIGRPGSATDFCSEAGLRPRQSESRRGSKPSWSSSEGTRIPSALRPSSNTVAGTTNGLATLRRGAKLGVVTSRS